MTDRHTNAAMPTAERDRLQKLLALIGSNQVGERDAAVSAATRLLERHRLRWSEILSIAHVEIRPQDPPGADPFGGRDWRSVAARCRQFPHLINAWEDQFLADVPRCSMLTTKQSAKLVAIFTRLRATGCVL